MYATFLLPNFRLQAALRFAPPPWRLEPVALVHPRDAGSAILEISDQAAQQGVCAGMSPAQAFARCPALRLVSACPDSEHNTQQALLQVAWTLSPKVESTQSGLCTADVRRCRGELKPALSRAIEKLEQFQLSPRAGLASTPELSVLAAAKGSPLFCVENDIAFVAELPLHTLTQDSTLLGTLARWGIGTAGALLKLPRQEALERLGPAGKALWEAARGGRERPLRCAQEPVVFEESLAFEHGVETVAPLLFVLNRLLDSLLCRLKCGSRLVSGLQLELALENRSVYERRFTVPAPTLDTSVLLGILETHLEGLHLEHRPVGIRLRLEDCIGKNDTPDLFQPALRDPNRFGETLAKLYALLGESHVGIPLPACCHFSEPVHMGPAAGLYMEQRLPPPADVSPKRGLPLQRFRPPTPAHVGFLHSRPAHVTSESVSGKIVASRGPYRLSSYWWDASFKSVEEWDICVKIRSAGRSGTALARIASYTPAARSPENQTANWILDGIYNIQL
jgi:protein ImuB